MNGRMTSRTFSTSAARLAEPAHRTFLKDPSVKYKRWDRVSLPDRTWPNKVIEKAPRWLSSDLRDGNQALVNPMTGPQKERFFNKLVEVGFREIEVGFPSASDTEFDFVRHLVERKDLPEDLVIQTLAPARPDLITRTIESLKGARNVILHLYNATSPPWRDQVFRNSKEETIALAVRAVQHARRLIDDDIALTGGQTNWQLEYSPETFSQTEPEFAVEFCNAVQDAWFHDKDIAKEEKIIFNLPATVEVATPNDYADRVEYFCRHIKNREHVVVSLHCHNDRGTGIAATELGLMAGGDRVEGCVFGNGERTGNIDLVTMAMNLYTTGVSPNLDLSDLPSLIALAEQSNDLPVHPRHPWSGSLVFTAFSGSHQDAIKKGFQYRDVRQEPFWEVPYLPVDPADVGGTYEAVIRVNSQSGKGGVAYVLQRSLNHDIPKRMQPAVYSIIQGISDRTSKEINQDDIVKAFKSFYYLGEENTPPITLLNYSFAGDQEKTLNVSLNVRGERRELTGRGNGPVSALVDALRAIGHDVDVDDYSEHAIGQGRSVEAASYVLLTSSTAASWGVAVDNDTSAASLKAVLSALNGLNEGTARVKRVEDEVIGYRFP